MQKDFQPIRNLITPATAHLRNQMNNINAGVKIYEIAVKSNSATHKGEKWLTSKKSLPKFARFKLVIEYKVGKCAKQPYPSIDDYKRYDNEKIYKIHSEEIGFGKLLDSKMVRETPHENYWRIVIYANLTNDLRYPDSWAYDHKVLEIEKGIIAARYMILRYFPSGHLDIQKTLLDTEIARAQGLIQTPFKNK